MAVTRARQEIAPYKPLTDEDARRIINSVRRGQTNNGGEVTLTANSATTTLSDDLITKNSGIFLQPTTANAAAALSGLYFSAPTTGSVVINHANNAQADRTFKFGVFF
jgi:hypothetical protein